MNLFSKLFKRNKFKLEGENLILLSDLANKIANHEGNEKDIKLIESFIYFNKANPYLHQLCALAYFLKKENNKADFHFDEAIKLNIKDGGWSLLTKALNNIFETYTSYAANSSLRYLIENRELYQSHTKGEIIDGIFLNKNEFSFSSLYIDLRSSFSLGLTYYSYSSCCSDFGEKSEAIEYINKTIELCPDNEDWKAKKAELISG